MREIVQRYFDNDMVTYQSQRGKIELISINDPSVYNQKISIADKLSHNDKVSKFELNSNNLKVPLYEGGDKISQNLGSQYSSPDRKINRIYIDNISNSDK